LHRERDKKNVLFPAKTSLELLVATSPESQVNQIKGEKLERRLAVRRAELTDHRQRDARDDIKIEDLTLCYPCGPNDFVALNCDGVTSEINRSGEISQQNGMILIVVLVDSWHNNFDLVNFSIIKMLFYFVYLAILLLI